MRHSGNAWVRHHGGDLGGGERETRWLTPPRIVEALGEFDLDPCGAPDHVLAKKTYLLENNEDGLALPWSGRVWLNPPYGRGPQHAFLHKLADHGTGTALIFARTDTRSFHDVVWNRASAILFLLGRLTFLSSDGVPARANAGAASCLVAYGDPDHALLAGSGLPGRLVQL